VRCALSFGVVVVWLILPALPIHSTVPFVAEET